MEGFDVILRGLLSPLISPVGQAGSISRTPADVFNDVFIVFLGLGTIVGVVVTAYTLYNAWKYRDTDPKREGDAEEKTEIVEEKTPKKVVRPELGKLPSGSGGGKKLFLSFGISALIVLSLIVWTYGLLLFVEDTPDQNELEIDVTGQQFSWTFTYPNGNNESTLRVPVDRSVELKVTSADVMHNIGIPELKAKTDAIPGTTTSTWFHAEETGEHWANCYELCGTGHSGMRAKVIVMEQDEYQDWYESTTGN